MTGSALALVLEALPAVLAGDTLLWRRIWLPSLGIDLSFRLDGLGMLFCLLILGIGLLVILYARYYLSPQDPMGRFYALLLLFMGAMLGIVLAGNLLLLWMFWELTSLSSFLLIGYWSHRFDARQGARLALTLTGGGGLALLAGILLLGRIAGSFELSVILAAGDSIKPHPLYPWVLSLILLGVFTKSAQFPFHFWLPQAMAAPTPVSAYLHSATLVKAGIFLLARLFPALAGTELWFYLVSGVGLTTLLFGACQALFKHDLKSLLAYSTISHLGLIVLLFGLGTPLGEVAGVFHIINHAIFKASLFMAAGIVDHEAGTRDMRRVNGLFRYMPQTAVLAIVAAAAMAGVPLLNGFLSKEMFFGEILDLTWMGGWYWGLPAVVTLAGAFSVAYSVRFIHDVFFNGEPIDLPRAPQEPDLWLRIPMGLLAALCLLVGVAPEATVAPVLAVAAGSVLLNQPLPAYDLAVWHGLNWPLLMSMTALAGGVFIYAWRRPLFRLHDRYRLMEGRRRFHRLLQAVTGLARRLTGTLENGSLQHYLALLLVSALVAGGTALLSLDTLTGPVAPGAVDSLGVLGAAILALAAVATVGLQRRRLTALILISVVGLMVCLAFVRFSAPDLALTQILVETVTTVLLLLALYFLPQQAPVESSPGRRLRDAVLAILAGLGAGALTWGVLTRPYDDTIAEYFLANSVPLGGGANVVNVILVDFRGFDTLGEITVLAIAALGIYALLEGLRLPTPSAGPLGGAWAGDRQPLIMRVVSRALLPLILLVAVYLLLRGHQRPGGGFIAGLVTALALVLQYLAAGLHQAQAVIQRRYPRLIAAGLGLVVLTGLASWAFGYPFLTSTVVHLHWPIVGDIELASAMIFDLGVYLTVVGVVMLILAALGHLGILSRAEPPRSPRERLWKG